MNVNISNNFVPYDNSLKNKCSIDKLTFSFSWNANAVLVLRNG